MQNVLTWVVAHKASLMAVGIALIDGVFALSPSLKSNGIVHWIYLTLGGKDSA